MLEPFALPDRYRLEGGIAAGGMASVYAAHDKVLDRPVAVKVLADHLNDDETARRRFEREARLAAAVSNHPGVVTIFDVGEFNGRAFIVMELRQGGTVGDAGRVDRSRALGWLRTVADAIDAAHERGVVHRDLKPGNLLLDERGAVAVADFGIASLMDDTERFTQTGQVLGTAAYLSPEQATGDAATPASDRYSLAVVAYEMLSGAKPFDTGSFAAQARAHIETPPPDAPGLPRPAQQVLKRGLAKAPEDRWPTGGAFVDALAEALAVGPPPPPTPPHTERTRAMPASAPRRERGRRTGAILAAAAALIFVAAALAVALGGEGGDDGGAETSPSQAAIEPEKTKKPKREPAPAAETPVPTAEPTEEPTEAPTEAPVEATGDPAALNAEGYDLYLAGDYAGAVAPLQAAVEACGDSTELDPCGYAVYNLGSALHRNGQSAEAIPYIEDRLARFEEFKVEEVQAELAAAQENAGR